MRGTSGPVSPVNGGHAVGLEPGAGDDVGGFEVAGRCREDDAAASLLDPDDLAPEMDLDPAFA